MGTLNYDLDFGGSVVAGMMNAKPIAGLQYSGKVLGTNYLIWGASTLEKEPSFSGLATLERIGEKGLTLGLETAVAFDLEGYQLSQEKLRLGYTTEEGVGVGLAGNFVQTKESLDETLGIYVRLTK